jgi:hypothetical protein
MTETFSDLMLELRSRVRDEEVPAEVVKATARLAECPQELCCFVLEAHPTAGAGAPKVSPGFQPSDLLLKLVAALRAAEWEKFVILVHSGLSPTCDCGISLPDPLNAVKG